MPALSIIVPTRERAHYLPHCIRTCVADSSPELEILILDNASTDSTPEVVAAMTDPRIRYVRNETRLSMRDNFEKGLELSRGDILCYLGDDDGLLPGGATRAVQLFRQENIEAVAAARAHYYWPDLVTPRRGTALLPRGSGVTLLESRTALLSLLDDCDYYRLPCLYHGFVGRAVVERIRQRQGRFFSSSQVDIYSAIALSMENIRYAFSRAPLLINGGSSRSNGASHFGGGTPTERSLWKREDDLGFLPGFENYATLGSLILESGLRYCQANPRANIFDMFGRERVEQALANERARRMAVGDRSAERTAQMFASAGVGLHDVSLRGTGRNPVLARMRRLAKTFSASRPVDMGARGVSDVFEASQQLASLLQSGQTGPASNAWEQITTALRLARG